MSFWNLRQTTPCNVNSVQFKACLFDAPLLNARSSIFIGSDIFPPTLQTVLSPVSQRYHHAGGEQEVNKGPRGLWPWQTVALIDPHQPHCACWAQCCYQSHGRAVSVRQLSEDLLGGVQQDSGCLFTRLPCSPGWSKKTELQPCLLYFGGRWLQQPGWQDCTKPHSAVDQFRSLLSPYISSPPAWSLWHGELGKANMQDEAWSGLLKIPPEALSFVLLCLLRCASRCAC